MSRLSDLEVAAFGALDAACDGDTSFVAIAERIAERAYIEGLKAGRASVIGELAWWGQEVPS